MWHVKHFFHFFKKIFQVHHYLFNYLKLLLFLIKTKTFIHYTGCHKFSCPSDDCF